MIETLLLVVIILLAVLVIMCGYIILQIGAAAPGEEIVKPKRKKRAVAEWSKEDRDLMQKVDGYTGGIEL